jgi:hypothetical protein
MKSLKAILESSWCHSFWLTVMRIAVIAACVKYIFWN